MPESPPESRIAADPTLRPLATSVPESTLLRATRRLVWTMIAMGLVGLLLLPPAGCERGFTREYLALTGLALMGGFALGQLGRAVWRWARPRAR